MSYFNSNITGSSGGGGGASGLVTKLEKSVVISSSELAEVTIDISGDINNYADITNDRIIIELNNANAIAAGDAELSHTYNAETGVITITSTNSNIPFASSSAVELNVNVYIAGAVQLPPIPPAPENPLNQFTYLQNVVASGNGFIITFDNTDKKIKRIILNGYLGYGNSLIGYLNDDNTTILFNKNSNQPQTFPVTFDTALYKKLVFNATSYDDNWKTYIGGLFDLSKITIEYEA